jgi:hypothetical protein
MIRSMEGLSFASESNLNMGYFHIKLDAEAQKLCTIVLYSHRTWENTNKTPPMGIKIDWILMLFKIHL